jgi:GDP-L-fucose synthase
VATIVHAAGRVGGIAANVADPVGFFVDNTEIGTSLVQAADDAGVERLLNLSSSCVYPRGRELLAEDDMMTGPLEPTNEGYALAKIAVGRLCDWISADRPDRLYRTILPCNLYGPGDHFDKETSHLLAAIVSKVGQAARTGDGEVVIWGDGQARREFMHVQDLCGAVEFLLARMDRLPRYLNVGPGVDHTVDEYYETAARVIGWDGRFVHDLDRPVGMQRKLMDVSRLRALGWTPRIGLEDGLRDTYAWYERQAAVPSGTPS